MQNINNDIKAEIEAILAYEETEYFHGYRVSDLRKAFNAMTSGLSNWKVAFAVPNLLGEEVMPAYWAIVFFTGDDQIKVDLNVHTMRYTIETRGYYEAIGA